jgi:uncharacterized protein (TIGR01777 family)
MRTVLITGGTGLVGTALTQHLTSKGYAVIILTRDKPTEKKKRFVNVTYAYWDTAKQTIDINVVQKADHIIHLAGSGVMDKKWTANYKKQIVESRTKSSELLFNTLKNNSNKVRSIASASAIGWYGKDIFPNKKFTENDPADKSFLGETCRLWEANIEPVQQLDIRLVKLRTGIVLSNDGGAFAEFKKSLKFNLAAILGNGKQIISWIHIDDLCRLYIDAIENENLSGSYNVVTPEPVSNEQLITRLAQKIKGKFFVKVHVPTFVLKLILGEQSIEVLKSTTVSCNKIQQEGFRFLYPTVEAALEQLCNKIN